MQTCIVQSVLVSRFRACKCATGERRGMTSSPAVSTPMYGHLERYKGNGGRRVRRKGDQPRGVPLSLLQEGNSTVGDPGVQ